MPLRAGSVDPLRLYGRNQLVTKVMHAGDQVWPDTTPPPPPVGSAMLAFWDARVYSGTGKLLNLGTGGPSFDLSVNDAIWTAGSYFDHLAGSNIGLTTVADPITVTAAEHFYIGAVISEASGGNAALTFGSAFGAHQIWVALNGSADPDERTYVGQYEANGTGALSSSPTQLASAGGNGKLLLCVGRNPDTDKVVFVTRAVDGTPLGVPNGPINPDLATGSAVFSTVWRFGFANQYFRFHGAFIHRGAMTSGDFDDLAAYF